MQKVRYLIFIGYCSLAQNSDTILHSMTEWVISLFGTFVITFVMGFIVAISNGHSVIESITFTVFIMMFILVPVCIYFAAISVKYTIIAVYKTKIAREFLLSYGVIFSYENPSSKLKYIRQFKNGHDDLDRYESEKLYRDYVEKFY